jgi:membrane-associated protein
VSSVLEQILGQPAWLVYLVVGAVVLVEDALFVGFVVPGETAAILGGVTVALGRTDLAPMLLVVIGAAVVGDSIGYEVGHHLGPRLKENRLMRRHRTRVDQAEVLLRRRGVVTVFVGRWTAFLRAVVPALAGAARMPYRRFLPANVASGALWGTVVVVSGMLAGHSYRKVEQWLGTGSAVVITVLVLVGLAVWHRRRSHREPDEVDREGEPVPEG